MASVIALLGFLCQVVGLSGLHWSATFMVTLFSLFMTGVRAWVRRGFAEDPLWCPLPEKIELGRAVLHIVRNDWDKVHQVKVPQVEGCEWEILTGNLAYYWPQNEDKGTPSIHPELKKGTLRHKAIEYSRRLEEYALSQASDINVPSPKPSARKKFVLGLPSNKATRQCPEVQLLGDLLEAHGESISNLPLGKSWEVAKKLAIAIKGVMETIEKYNNKGYKWERKLRPLGPPWQKCSTNAMPDGVLGEEEIEELGGPDWQIDVQRERAVKDHWIVRRISEDIQGDPDLLARKLCAGLYLWVASLECGEELFDEAFNSPELTELPFCLEPQYRQGDQLFMRIVGDCPARMTQMEWWMRASSGQLKTVPAYNGEKNSGNLASTVWSAFGLYHSAAFE